GYSDYFLSFEPVKERYDASDVKEAQLPVLRRFYGELFAHPEWRAPELEIFTREWSEREGVKMKEIAMPFRMALTGMKVSPGIFEVAEHLGREESRRRVAHFGFIE
ncbi:MAG: glutamate--tRNA ligase, partial [Synergistaceae bacterium]|nr:glutamate--tRNA ligase [Synergistaceae bacterium]